MSKLNEKIKEAIKNNKLTELDLSGGLDISDEDADTLADLISENTSITKLNLHQAFIRGWAGKTWSSKFGCYDGGKKKLLKVLATNKNITDIDLSNNTIELSDELMHLVKTNSTLERLNLSNNEGLFKANGFYCGDQGGKYQGGGGGYQHLAKALLKNKTLKHLDVTQDYIFYTKDVLGFYWLFQHNKTLETIVINPLRSTRGEMGSWKWIEGDLPEVAKYASSFASQSNWDGSLSTTSGRATFTPDKFCTWVSEGFKKGYVVSYYAGMKGELDALIASESSILSSSTGTTSSDSSSSTTSVSSDGMLSLPSSTPYSHLDTKSSLTPTLSAFLTEIREKAVPKEDSSLSGTSPSIDLSFAGMTLGETGTTSSVSTTASEIVPTVVSVAMTATSSLSSSTTTSSLSHVTPSLESDPSELEPENVIVTISGQLPDDTSAS